MMLENHNSIVLLDANVIIRLFIEDNDTQWQESKDIFLLIATGKQKAIILPSVIMEVIFVMTKIYHIPTTEVLSSLQYIIQHEHIINTDKSDIILAFNIMKKHLIDFVDALLVAKHQLYQYQIKSFDKKVQKLCASNM